MSIWNSPYRPIAIDRKGKRPKQRKIRLNPEIQKLDREAARANAAAKAKYDQRADKVWSAESAKVEL